MTQNNQSTSLSTALLLWKESIKSLKYLRDNMANLDELEIEDYEQMQVDADHSIKKSLDAIRQLETKLPIIKGDESDMYPEKNNDTNAKTFLVPVLWQSWGTMKIEANSEKEAMEIALGEAPLPEAHYIEDSCVIDVTREIEQAHHIYKIKK